VGKPKGKKPLGRPGHRWEVKIKMGIKEVGLEDVDRIYLAQNGNKWWDLVNTVMNFWTYKNAGDVWTR
jgi:hypothetical protein